MILVWGLSAVCCLMNAVSGRPHSAALDSLKTLCSGLSDGSDLDHGLTVALFSSLFYPSYLVLYRALFSISLGTLSLSLVNELCPALFFIRLRRSFMWLSFCHRVYHSNLLYHFYFCTRQHVDNR